MLPNSTVRRRWVVDPICALILLASVAGHLLHLRDGEALSTADSHMYMRQAEHPLTDSRFWTGGKPPLYSFWYKAVGAFGDTELDARLFTEAVVPRAEPVLPAAQTALSLLAFTMLAFACARTARTRAGRRLLFALPLAISLAPLVAKWNQVVMSELLSMSLLAFFVAAWFLYFHRPSWWALAAIAASAACWAAVRDTNYFTVAMIVPLAALAGVGGRRKSAALCIALIAAFALANALESRSDRKLFPFYNVVGQRILPHPDRVDFFASVGGMPTSPALAERSGKWASDDHFALYGDPRLELFRRWSADRGMSTYVKFLLAHPFYSLASPATEIGETFLSRLGWALRMDWISPDEPVAPWLAAALRWAVLLGYGAAILSAFALWRRRRFREAPWLLVPLGMALLSLPQLWLVWHGDAMGYVRHGLTAVLCFLLGGLLLWAATVDRSLAQANSRVRNVSETPDGSTFWTDASHRLGASAVSLLAIAACLIAANPTKQERVSHARWDRETDPTVKAVALNAPLVGDVYERGETIEATVIFDRVVDVTGSPQLALRIGSNTRQASYVDINDAAHPGYDHRFGSNMRQAREMSDYRIVSLLFRYQLVQADVDADGISVAADALTLNGGTIKLYTGTGNAQLGLGDHAIANDGDRKVDGAKFTAPRVDQVRFRRVPTNDDTYLLDERIFVSVDFDRPVTVTGSPQLALAIGQETKGLPLRRFVPPTQLRFRYVVQPGDFDADGVSVFEGALTLNGGTINDARDATVPARLALRRPAGRYKVDGQPGPPAVAGVR